MPGLAIVQASSEAWPENGAQAERALNTGWILDQRVDGAGGFVTNTSPTSSGLTFQSSGDGTTGSGNGLYTVGRPVRVLQSGSSAYAKVSSASVALGVTTVILGNFSTNASTALSTGAVTSAAVGPMLRDFGTSGDILYASSNGSPARLAIGTTGSFLSVVGGIPSWVGVLATASATLSADIASTSTGTFHDIVSVSLTTGTWHVTGATQVTMLGQTWVVAKLWDGSNAIVSGQYESPAGALSFGVIPLAAHVPVTVAGTWKISTIAGAASTNNIVVAATTPSQGNNATYIYATKVSIST